MGNSPRTSSIHILDDDCLLHVFYLYRPFLLGEDEDETARLFGGKGNWVNGRWWYKLARVCQKWRNVILGSAHYLGVFLVCSNGMPVGDMLAHSPPLPLVIDYNGHHRSITEDEEGAILALRKRDRVRLVRLGMAVTNLQKIIAAMDQEFPILEYLILMPPPGDKSTILKLPETLQAPHLRHLTLVDWALPIGSRLLTTAVGLVTFCLVINDPSTYFRPNSLLHSLSCMPRLEMLAIFCFAGPNRETEGQLMQTPIAAPVTLPNLHFFRFSGVSADLEALIHRIAAPRLESLQIIFFNQQMFSVPRLVQFMNTTENLRFDSAKFSFNDGGVWVDIYPRGEFEMYALSIRVFCEHLDWQVSFVAQISNSLIQISSAAEHLTLGHKGHRQTSEEHNTVDPTEWHKLLRPFRNVKTLHIGSGLVEQLSRCLELEDEDGELPLELLPGLQELTYSASGTVGDAFASFISARQNAGRPGTLVLESERDDPALLSQAQGFPTVTSGSSEAGSNLSA